MRYSIDQIESLFNGNLIVVGTCLLVTALLLFASSRIQTQAGEITFKRSFIIGIAQAIAILPGLSRSGATISTALISGVSREKAARFSFLMVLPVIIGAMILDLKDFSEESTASMVPTASLIAGFLAAFLAGIAACHWMIAIVKRSKLDYFAYYCALVGTIALVVALFFLE